MTTKKIEEQKVTRDEPVLETQEFELAQRVHTLAQLIHGELAVEHPWVASSFFPTGYQVPTAWPPSPLFHGSSTWPHMGWGA